MKKAHLFHLVTSGRELLCGRHFADPQKKCSSTAAHCTPKGTRVTRIVEKSQRGQRVALVVESGPPLQTATDGVAAMARATLGWTRRDPIELREIANSSGHEP